MAEPLSRLMLCYLIACVKLLRACGLIQTSAGVAINKGVTAA